MEWHVSQRLVELAAKRSGFANKKSPLEFNQSYDYN